MRRNYVQFALDVDTIGYLKLIALERHVTLTSLLQNIVFEFLGAYVAEKVNNSQAAEPQKGEL